MLARYGQLFQLPSAVAKDADSEVLQDLLRRRKQVVDQRVQEGHRLDKGLTEGARTSAQRHIQWLDKEISRLDDEYRKVLENSTRLAPCVEYCTYRPWRRYAPTTTCGGSIRDCVTGARPARWPWSR